jgi:hypothetical protein
MKKFSLLVFLLITLPQAAYSWDFSLRGDFSQRSTDNVNGTSTGLIKDKYSTFNTYAQVKDEEDRFRLRVRATRYDKTTTNDSNYYEGSYQRRFDDNLEDSFTLKFFSEKYTKTPTLSTDTSSDNRGYEAQLFFLRELKNNFSVNSTYALSNRTYPNIANRKDSRYDGIFGLEKIVKDVLTIAPEISLTYNKSKDSYYTYFLVGGGMTVTLQATDDLDLSLGYSQAKTFYQERMVTTIVNGRSSSTEEDQTAKTIDASMSYYATKWLSLEASYSISDNTSNNTDSVYKAKEFEFGIGLKY